MEFQHQIMVAQNKHYVINVRYAKLWVYEESMNNYSGFIPLVPSKGMQIDKQ